MNFDNWQEEYEAKTVDAEEAVKTIGSGDTVVFPVGREPEALGFALASRYGELENIHIIGYSTGRDFGWFDPGWEERFDVKVGYVFPRGVAREWMDERRGDHLVGSLMSPSTKSRPGDVVIVEVSQPDKHGFCSFGASLWDKKEQIAAARATLAEVNPRLIRTAGDNFIHVSEITHFVVNAPTSGWGITKPVAVPTEILQPIAHLVSTLVNDGDCIQVGAGTISESLPNAGAFDEKHDLGLHTEMTARGLVRLIRQGVINGRQKTLHRGKVIATAAGGSSEDMAFIDANPLFELYSVFYTSDPRIISQNDNMVAINNTLAVDFTGQVASESLGSRMWSGSGGQPAFSIGASLSKGGRTIFVLPSTAQTKQGLVSRIVPSHAPGTIITVPRTAVDYVLTEHGIAYLRGKSQRERTLALIDIAHPDFRFELRREANKIFWP